MASMHPCLVGKESCGGAHFWGRTLLKMGHDARLIHPPFIKPYVKRNKNDHADAEAICEAVGNANMRFVPIKSIEQQDLSHRHRIRQRWMTERTRLINQVRGFLLEHGIEIAAGVRRFEEGLPKVLADLGQRDEPGVSQLSRDIAGGVLGVGWTNLRCEMELSRICNASELCRRLLTIPGIGVLTATALVVAVGDGSCFRNGQELAAWVGLVPRQYSTGGRTKLLGISKRGDRYLHVVDSRCTFGIAKRMQGPRHRAVLKSVGEASGEAARLELGRSSAGQQERSHCLGSADKRAGI